MSEYTYFMLTVYYESEKTLLKTALAIKNDYIPEDVANFPENNKEWLHSMLPLHVRSCGPVVSVDSLFSISTVMS